MDKRIISTYYIYIFIFVVNVAIVSSCCKSVGTSNFQTDHNFKQALILCGVVVHRRLLNLFSNSF